ncbi:hypothetical protein [Streptomyces acidicola]|uniref:hypothetical protein n=1 Tax=Streptomyces acidicola TaxID=2596892 RepID=UPI001883DE25|nr:hypothetical protein [Streptomyces acidicola]
MRVTPMSNVNVYGLIQARGPLGFFGNFLPVAYINVFAGIGCCGSPPAAGRHW